MDQVSCSANMFIGVDERSFRKDCRERCLLCRL